MSLDAKPLLFQKFLLVPFLLITFLVSFCNKAAMDGYIPGTNWVYLTVVGLARFLRNQQAEVLAL